MLYVLKAQRSLFRVRRRLFGWTSVFDFFVLSVEGFKNYKNRSKRNKIAENNILGTFQTTTKKLFFFEFSHFFRRWSGCEKVWSRNKLEPDFVTRIMQTPPTQYIFSTKISCWTRFWHPFCRLCHRNLVLPNVQHPPASLDNLHRCQ